MAIPVVPPRAYAPLLGLERERLVELLESLGPDEWHRPTPCPGWDVLGLTTHLVGDDVFLLSSQRDGHLGSIPPAGVDEAGFVSWLDGVQDEWVRAARRVSPRVALDLLRWLGPQVDALVAGQDASVLDAHVSWAAREPVPRWLDHARELTERWLHRQQLLEAVDRPTDRRADLADPVLDTLRWAFPFRVASHARPAGSTVAVAAGEHRWFLVSDGTEWDFGAAGGPVLAELRFTTEQAWRLPSNNLDPAVHGMPEVSGDPELVSVLLHTRSIIGAPSVRRAGEG
jgi:uncharacterized protein (TIGR03083 family)